MATPDQRPGLLRLSAEHRQALNEIPVVDMKDFYSEDGRVRDRYIQTVAEGLHDIGFIFVQTPDITPKLPGIYQTYKQVFSLPLDVKMQYARPDIHHQRGYTGQFTEIGIFCQHSGPNGSAQPDAKENFFIGPNLPPEHSMVQLYPALYAPNVWPKEVPEFQSATTELYGDLFGVGKEVLKALEVYLGYEEGFFEDVVAESPTSLRPLHYPPVTEEQLGSIVWGCEHTDINFVTVLPASTKKGLWVQTRSGTWIPGMAPPGCSLVQVGDMLQYMTGGYFLSAHHKVDAPTEPTTEGRYSSALFIHANSNRTLQVDRRLATNPEQYPDITAADYLYLRLKQIGLAKEEAKAAE